MEFKSTKTPLKSINKENPRNFILSNPKIYKKVKGDFILDGQKGSNKTSVNKYYIGVFDGYLYEVGNRYVWQHSN